jgi:YtkA-like protein
MKTGIAISIALVAVIVIATACGSKSGSQNSTTTGKVIKSVPIGNNLTMTLSSQSGALKSGDQEVTVTTTDASGKPVDLGAMSLNFHMDQMGTMAAMNSGVTFTTTSTPGICRGKVKIESAGEWQGQFAYEGPAGKGKTTFSVTAR